MCGILIDSVIVRKTNSLYIYIYDDNDIN